MSYFSSKSTKDNKSLYSPVKSNNVIEIVIYNLVAIVINVIYKLSNKWFCNRDTLKCI